MPWLAPGPCPSPPGRYVVGVPDLSRIVHRVHRRAAACLAAAAVLAVVTTPSGLSAQRRPGVPMGFYTTTGLVTADVEGGSVTTSTTLAEAPTFAASVLVTGALRKLPKRAIIVGIRATPLAFGNNGSCVVSPGVQGCQNVRFEERLGVMVGGAFDIRSTLLRTMIGPSLYDVETQGARIGTTVRIDFASPRLRGPTPTLFFTRTFLGSQRGQGAAHSTLGAGFRWVRKK
jgi:hypothetical protein